jgi:Galactose oxidase, central domain
MKKPLWIQRHTLGPSPRAGCAMTYDRARKRMLLFGGLSGNAALNDTWEWDGIVWTQVADFGPDVRYDHGMAYDENRKTVVLFGGIADIRPGERGPPKSDTWEWDGEYWIQVAGVGPSGRAWHAMASDTANKRIVLFGGEGGGVSLHDTWLWDGNQWVQHEGVGPNPRKGHAMSYDPNRQKVVLFGGLGLPVAVDTWEWDGVQWKRVAEFGPGPRAGLQLCFNGGQTVLFGGAKLDESTGNYVGGPLGALGDTWEWDGHRWVERRNFGPSGRMQYSMDYDSDRGRTVLFGGSTHSEGPYADTWELFDREPIPPPG